MELNLKLNGKREKAKVSFAQPGDFGFAETWRQALGDDQNPLRNDAVDFAHLALKRFEASAGLGIYATFFCVEINLRWGGLIRERGLVVCAIGGNIVTSWSWFGVNMLGIGLHSYGFTDAAFKWLVLFVVSQIVFIMLGLMPVNIWRSFHKKIAA